MTVGVLGQVGSNLLECVLRACGHSLLEPRIIGEPLKKGTVETILVFCRSVESFPTLHNVTLYHWNLFGVQWDNLACLLFSREECTGGAVKSLCFTQLLFVNKCLSTISVYYGRNRKPISKLNVIVGFVSCLTVCK